MFTLLFPLFLACSIPAPEEPTPTPMTNEIMYSRRKNATLRKSRYERRHPILTMKERRALTRYALSTKQPRIIRN